ncbi:MAG: sn-glycerol-3-phosphate ABC transporter ATP-binding protein UgpC [Candidatus Gastranaerophilales bacterium]|nr:sn-glycerol-3-phosphate ABC transporter ATP-binding protein UgpC [Candidatus Gastranaerophilales bacterium]
MAKVEFKNVDKIYESNKTKTVDNLNLEIRDKEFLVLVGPSGCGKSTILRMIAGLESISSGELFIGDEVVNDVHPKDRDIAMVFQNYALYPHMTIKENMAFGLKMRKFKKDEIEKRVLEAAKILDLTDYLDKKPKQLSGGQRQRVALGRAMVREPKVFLMDEPLSNLDAKLRVQMRSEIKKLHKRISTTFVYVTHDQVEALTMGDRIVILNKGYVQQIGTPQEVYSDPDNIFTAGFVGSPAMNFFNAKVLNENEIEIYSQKVSLSESMKNLVQKNNLINKEVVFAVRPEFFTNNSSTSIEITPTLIELLGNEKLVHFSFEDKKFCAKLPQEFEIEENKSINLPFDINKAFLFDKTTEQRIR